MAGPCRKPLQVVNVAACRLHVGPCMHSGASRHTIGLSCRHPQLHTQMTHLSIITASQHTCLACGFLSAGCSTTPTTRQPMEWIESIT